MTRARYIPTDAEARTEDGVDAVVYCYGTKPCAVAYHGKGSKQDWHNQFRTVEQRDKRIAEHFASIRAHDAMVAKYKAERAQGHKDAAGINAVGRVLVSTWGYDQTNQDFYQITAQNGGMATLRPIASRVVDTLTDMSENVRPMPGVFLKDGKQLRRRLTMLNGKATARIASYSVAEEIDERRSYFVSTWG